MTLRSNSDSLFEFPLPPYDPNRRDDRIDYLDKGLLELGYTKSEEKKTREREHSWSYGKVNIPVGTDITWTYKKRNDNVIIVEWSVDFREHEDISCGPSEIRIRANNSGSQCLRQIYKRYCQEKIEEIQKRARIDIEPYESYLKQTQP